jgi:hypothetical protein
MVIHNDITLDKIFSNIHVNVAKMVFPLENYQLATNLNIPNFISTLWGFTCISICIQLWLIWASWFWLVSQRIWQGNINKFAKSCPLNKIPYGSRFFFVWSGFIYWCCTPRGHDTWQTWDAWGFCAFSSIFVK